MEVAVLRVCGAGPDTCLRQRLDDARRTVKGQVLEALWPCLHQLHKAVLFVGWVAATRTHTHAHKDAVVPSASHTTGSCTCVVQLEHPTVLDHSHWANEFDQPSSLEEEARLHDPSRLVLEVECPVDETSPTHTPTQTYGIFHARCRRSAEQRTRARKQHC